MRPKIKISETAYLKLSNILCEVQGEFNCFRLDCSEGCCKHSKVDIILDNMDETHICDKVQDLPIIYPKGLAEQMKEIIIIYKNNTFMIKTITNNPSHSNCGGCGSDCSNSSNNCGNCGGCRKDG